MLHKYEQLPVTSYLYRASAYVDSSSYGFDSSGNPPRYSSRLHRPVDQYFADVESSHQSETVSTASTMNSSLGSRASAAGRHAKAEAVQRSNFGTLAGELTGVDRTPVHYDDNDSDYDVYRAREVSRDSHIYTTALRSPGTKLHAAIDDSRPLTFQRPLGKHDRNGEVSSLVTDTSRSHNGHCDEMVPATSAVRDLVRSKSTRGDVWAINFGNRSDAYANHSGSYARPTSVDKWHHDIEIDTLRRQLRRISEENAMLLRQRADAERQLQLYLEESDSKCKQVTRLCDNLSSMVGHYEPLIAEQQAELEQLRCKLQQKETQLAQSIEQQQYYESLNKNFEQRLACLHEILKQERKQVKALKQRVIDGELSPNATQNSTPIDNDDSVIAEVRSEYEKMRNALEDTVSELRKSNERNETLGQSLADIKSRDRKLLEYAFSKPVSRRVAPPVVTVQLTDQFDALVLPECLKRVGSRASTTATKLLVSLGDHSPEPSDDLHLVTTSAGVLFASSRHQREQTARLYCLRSRDNLPLPSTVKTMQVDDRKLFRMLRTSLGLPPLALRRTPISLGNDVSGATIVAGNTAIERLSNSCRRACSKRREFARSRCSYSTSLQDSILEEQSDEAEPDGGYESPQLPRRSRCLCEVEVQTEEEDEVGAGLANNGAPQKVMVDVGVGSEIPDVGESKLRLHATDSVSGVEEDGRNRSESETATKKLITDLKSVQKYDELVSSMYRMTELEVEERFALVTSHFKSSRPTLVKRAEQCDHRHKIAEHNLGNMFQHLHTSLQTMTEELSAQKLVTKKGTECTACGAASRSCQQAIKYLELLEKCVFRFTSRSEQLGALQEELRTSNACEIMMACFDALKFFRVQTLKELDEAKRFIEVFENESRMSLTKRLSVAGLTDSEDDKLIRKQRVNRFATAGSIIQQQWRHKASWPTVNNSLSFISQLRQHSQSQLSFSQGILSAASAGDLQNAAKPIEAIASDSDKVDYERIEDSSNEDIWLKHQATQWDESDLPNDQTEIAAETEETRENCIAMPLTTSGFHWLARFIVAMFAAIGTYFYVHFSFGDVLGSSYKANAASG